MASDAQKRATIKYAKKTYKRIPLDLRLDDYERLKSFCDASGDTINGFIKKAINDRLDRLNQS